MAVALINGKEVDSDKPSKLPDCPYIDPIEEMEKWHNFDHTACNVSGWEPNKEKDPKAYEKYEWGLKHFAFNSYASDKIGPRRLLTGESWATHKKCLGVEYKGLKLKASIIIIYHNEAFSVLVRMINGILKDTPADLLADIILYDDSSEEEVAIEKHLKKYAAIAKWDIVKFYSSEQREGLIKAKVQASRKGTGDVLVFMDSHCEVTGRWLQPLLAPIQEDKKRVILPIVDVIDPLHFEYTKAMIAKGTFDWRLHFHWEYFPWSHFDDEENYVRLFKSVSMSGGLLAIDREYFKELGEFDEGMQIWGSENIELSLRVWMCGGSIMTAPCSRVGPIFRTRRPYKGKPGVDTDLYNSLRTVEVWFDDYKRHFLDARPSARKMDAGDIEERVALRKKLNCHPFSWYIDNVHHTLKEKLLEKTEL